MARLSSLNGGPCPRRGRSLRSWWRLWPGDFDGSRRLARDRGVVERTSYRQASGGVWLLAGTNRCGRLRSRFGRRCMTKGFWRSTASPPAGDLTKAGNSTSHLYEGRQLNVAPRNRKIETRRRSSRRWDKVTSNRVGCARVESEARAARARRFPRVKHTPAGPSATNDLGSNLAATSESLAAFILAAPESLRAWLAGGVEAPRSDGGCETRSL